MTYQHSCVKMTQNNDESTAGNKSSSDKFEAGTGIRNMRTKAAPKWKPV